MPGGSGCLGALAVGHHGGGNGRLRQPPRGQRRQRLGGHRRTRATRAVAMAATSDQGGTDAAAGAAAVAAAPWGRVNPGPTQPRHATAFAASATGAAVAALWCVSGRGRVVLACGPLRDLRTAGDVGLMTWPGRYSSARAAVSVPQATGKQKPQRSVREGAAVAGPSRPHKKTPPPSNLVPQLRGIIVATAGIVAQLCWSAAVSAARAALPRDSWQRWPTQRKNIPACTLPSLRLSHVSDYDN